MAYTRFESTNMASTKYAERIFDAVATTDIENGTFGYLNGLADGESVTYNFVKGTKEGAEVVVADNPAWSEDTTKITNQARRNYIIKAGTRFRARVIKKDDEFGITIEGVTPASQAAMKPKAFVTIDGTTGKLVASATAPSGSPIFVGEVMRKRVDGGRLVTAGNVNYGYSADIFEVKVNELVK